MLRTCRSNGCIIVHSKRTAGTNYCIIIGRGCAYIGEASAAGATYTKPCFAIRICCGCHKRIAESCLTVRKNYHAFVPSGGIGRIKQLLRLVYARLLVRSAVIAVGFYRYRVNLAD